MGFVVCFFIVGLVIVFAGVLVGDLTTIVFLRGFGFGLPLDVDLLFVVDLFKTLEVFGFAVAGVSQKGF